MNHGGWWQYISQDERRKKASIDRPLLARVFRYARPYLGAIIAVLVAITLRSLITLLPPLVISIFFLVIYESTLGEAAGFLPGLSGNSYLGFILPLSLVSSALSGSSLAAQNLVRDIESGYFDKLLLTPVSRTALLLGPILAGGFILRLQAIVVIGGLITATALTLILLPILYLRFAHPRVAATPLLVEVKHV